jgi:hypothetical protein
MNRDGIKIMFVAIILACAVSSARAETVTLDAKAVYCELMESSPGRIKNAQLYACCGNPEDISKNLSGSIVRGEKRPPAIFSENDAVTLVVFRGLFWNGGRSVRVEKLERAGNTFYVHASYIDAARGLFVIQVRTYPTALVGVGTLPKGKYEAKLMVTRVTRDWKGGYVDIVQEKERDKERASIAFEVK